MEIVKNKASRFSRKNSHARGWDSEISSSKTNIPSKVTEYDMVEQIPQGKLVELRSRIAIQKEKIREQKRILIAAESHLKSLRNLRNRMRSYLLRIVDNDPQIARSLQIDAKEKLLKASYLVARDHFSRKLQKLDPEQACLRSKFRR